MVNNDAQAECANAVLWRDGRLDVALVSMHRCCDEQAVDRVSPAQSQSWQDARSISLRKAYPDERVEVLVVVFVANLE